MFADRALEIRLAHPGATWDAELRSLAQEVASRRGARPRRARRAAGAGPLRWLGRRLGGLSLLAERLPEIDEESSQLSRQPSRMLVEDPLDVV
jgi:hypothetical protein